ncbi:extracellular solute-binding protein [Bacillus sp. 3255]|uniref:ABC transporter substrate-binding protein n=1 Tax=Bacillus sp. 3255 TaxID=2817904 RepID=UPI002854E639|nr:extracellular solute-binding protein [Bacillus sp. 3255]MDR6882419.1 multiple sugar transport system substrate-binding protein [Bacillus sp. 3255]
MEISKTRKKRFLKKSLLSILSFSVMTVGLAACGSTEDPKETPKVSSPVAKTKLTYWTAGRHDADYIKSKIDNFNSTNKDNIEVEMTVMAENFAQSLDLSFASGQSPDVFSLGDLVDFYNKGYVEPLDAFLNPEYKSRFGNGFVDGANVINGKIYTLPATGSTIRLIYNVDLLQKAGIQSPPKTLNELVDAAKKITNIGKKDGVYGFALPYKNASSALSRSAAAIAEVTGTLAQGYNFRTGKYDFTGYKPIIEAFKTMKANGSTLPGSESLDIDPLRAQFAEGKIGMYLSYSVEPGVYKNQFPAKAKWDAAPIPTIDGTYKGVFNLGVGASRWLAMSSKSVKKEAAWKFLSYMYGDEVLTGYQEQGLGLSVVPSIAAKAGKPEIAGMQNFLPTQYDGIWPVPPQGLKPEGRTQYEEFVKYILEGGDLDKIISDLNTRYNAALEKEVAAGKMKATIIPDFDPIKLQGSMIKK